MDRSSLNVVIDRIGWFFAIAFLSLIFIPVDLTIDNPDGGHLISFLIGGMLVWLIIFSVSATNKMRELEDE